MFRKLSLAVAISGLLSPVGVHALGLGDIHLGSALNQRLNAEISVHLARTEELDDIKIELASPEAFARAGIGRPFLLSSLRFSPVQNSDGETIIAVTSKEPIREPFLNFLVEVNWPKGRLVREYTVLLDPPVIVQRRAAPIDTPVVTPQLRATAPATGTMESSGAREYGPVVAEDTLWNIASRMRAEGESVEQVMMALLDNNSGAFIHNNINRLKRGSILRLPASGDVLSLDRKQARSDFLAQTNQWRDQNSVTASSINEMPPAAPTSDRGAKVQDHLKLASASKTAAESDAVEGSANRSASLNVLEQELILVREANEVVRQEGAQLRTRVGELEDQLQDIQRLLTLRNDQLAQIQNGQQQDVQPVESSLEAIVEEAPLEITVPAAVEEVVQEIQPAVQLEQAEPETPVTVEPEEMVEAAPVEEAAPYQPEEQPVVAVKPVKQPPAPSMVDTVMGNPALMAAGGGVVALLLGIAVFIIRRRKSTEAEFAESILVAPQGTAVDGSSDADLAPASTDETSLLSDFSPSDIDALQDETGEVDPLSEADVYVAYGRYQQAEELIQQAIEKDDDRIELKFKLLEIYYSIQNKSAFTELAQRLANEGAENKNPQAWAQVVSMGQELVPNEVLFGAAVEQQSEAAEALVENAVDELDDFDLGDLDAELGLGDDDDSLLNIDLDEGLAEVDEAVELVEEADSVADDLEIDLALGSDDSTLDLGADDSTLDLGDLSIADESLDLDDIDLSAELDGEINDLDLGDLSLSLDSELALDESESIEAVNEFASEEIDLGSLGEDLESLSGELDSGDFEIDLDEMDSTDEDEIQIEEVVESAPEDDGLESETEELSEDISDDDEVETKLDLARAYADMGDKEGAENILQEVIIEGTTEQREEAEALVKSLS